MQAMVLCVAASSLADTSVPVPAPSALSMEIKLRRIFPRQQGHQLKPSGADPGGVAWTARPQSWMKEAGPQVCFTGQPMFKVQRATSVCVMRPLQVHVHMTTGSPLQGSAPSAGPVCGLMQQATAPHTVWDSEPTSKTTSMNYTIQLFLCPLPPFPHQLHTILTC